MAKYKPPMTDARRTELDEMMKLQDGRITIAAKQLDMAYVTLRALIRSDAALHGKWMPDDWPNRTYLDEVAPDAAIHRHVDKETQIAVSVAKEEATLIDGWTSVGFTDEEAEELAVVAGFTNGKMDSIINFTVGGMIQNTTRLTLLCAKVTKELNKVMADPSAFDEYNKEGFVVYSGHRKMRELNDSLLGIMKEMRATNTAAEDSMITRAKIDEIKRVKEERAADGGKKKPAFKPLGGPPEVFGNTPNLTQNVTNVAPDAINVTDANEG